MSSCAPPSMNICVLITFPYKDTSATGLGPTPHSSIITPLEAPKYSHFPRSQGVKVSVYAFGEDAPAHQPIAVVKVNNDPGFTHSPNPHWQLLCPRGSFLLFSLSSLTLECSRAQTSAPCSSYALTPLTSLGLLALNLIHRQTTPSSTSPVWILPPKSRLLPSGLLGIV